MLHQFVEVHYVDALGHTSVTASKQRIRYVQI